MRRRMAGRLGRGGGPPLRQSAPFSPESQVLQEGEGELAQGRVVVQAAPAPTLEVVQPQLFLELLMQLLAHPARLDRDRQGLECRVGGKVGQVVLALAGRAMLPDEPGRCCPRAATGPSARRTRTVANAARSGPLDPIRHEMERNASGRASSNLAAATLAAEGTGCWRGRPVAFRSGEASVTSAG